MPEPTGGSVRCLFLLVTARGGGGGAISLILMIAMSRLYLGAHWFSDVAAGLAFGTLWLALLSISYLRGPVAAHSANSSAHRSRTCAERVSASRRAAVATSSPK